MFTIDESCAEHDEQDAQQQDIVQLPLRDREELVYKLLASLPRSQLAQVHRRITSFVQVDIITCLPDELSLLVLSYLSWQSLLKCTLVSKSWRALANSNTLWRPLCDKEGWEWKNPTYSRSTNLLFRDSRVYDSDDEGVGEDEDDAYPAQPTPSSAIVAFPEVVGLPASPRVGQSSGKQVASAPVGRVRLAIPPKRRVFNRHSSPPTLPNVEPIEPNYKLLHQTHRLLQARFRHGAFRFCTLQTWGTPDAHTGIIYCLQLYSYPEDGRQVLFTGSKDRTVREWNLRTGAVERVFEGAHGAGVLSLCAHGNYLATTGPDRRICIWALRGKSSSPILVLTGHSDSVLCVRFDDKTLVSCSKDKTVRICRFPGGIATALSPSSLKANPLKLDLLGTHRAAVNAVALDGNYVISGSGDRSLRLWDASTGALLRSFEEHHQRGIASIDFAYPLVMTGSSDCHLRAYDIEKRRGWCTSAQPQPLKCSASLCEACGGAISGEHSSSESSEAPSRRTSMHTRGTIHTSLVRSVMLGPHFVVSGGYDEAVKVWDRETGELIADFVGKHDSRVCGVGIDYTKIVSCGSDQKICIWDVSYGVDTSFIKL